MADNLLIPISGGTATVRTKDRGAGHDQVLTIADSTGTLLAFTSTGRVPTAPGAETSGGASTYRLLSAATTNAQVVKSAAGQLYAWHLTNLSSTSARFVKLYNKASAPTVGTDTPVLTLPLPAGGQANVAFPVGLVFATGIALAITGGVADSDTTSVAANDVIVNLAYA